MSWIIYLANPIIDMIRLIIRLAIKWFIIEKTLLVPIFDKYYVFLMFLHTDYKMKWSKIVYVVDKMVKIKPY